MPAWDEDEKEMLRLELTDAGLVLAHNNLWVDADQNVGALELEGHVVVGWIEIQWRGAAPPPDYVLRAPVHLPPPVTSERLSEAIEKAREAGSARRQTCRYCGEAFNPGWMHEPDICQGCAEEHLGVVH